MGSIYLDWLADEVAAACAAHGYDFAVYDDDWLHRARSSGGYDALPLCVMWHHTAGGDDAWADARYQCESADAAPISNITVDSRIAIVCAGGATNTNGSGSAQTFSRGTVPEDSMNTRAVGIEICNDGAGAPYPQRQIDVLLDISNRINARCGNLPADLCTHQRYAPERKIDPATAAAVQGAWQPTSCTSAGSWHVDDLRAEATRRSGTAPPEEGDEVTDEDIERIAKRAAELVWDHLEPDIVSDSDMTMATMLRYTRSDANKTLNRVS